MPANAALETAPASPSELDAGPRRLVVTWQDPRTRAFHVVGALECRGRGYAFRYAPRVDQLERFRPFLGFSDVGRRYESAHLFPLFAERVMDPSRPDRPRWLESLGLESDPDVMEILARSGGRRSGDSIEVLAVPEVASDGSTRATFLTHGVSHVEGAPALISRLRPGDALQLVDQPDNQVDPLAIQVVGGDTRPLGWVPGPLVDYAHAVRASAEHRVTVVRANGPEVGPHLRLLVRLDGHVDPTYRPFADLFDDDARAGRGQRS